MTKIDRQITFNIPTCKAPLQLSRDRRIQASPSDAVSAKFANMSFVCACLVVCIHSGNFLGNVTKAAVPFFFLCSGYMLARHATETGWYGRELKKRVQSVLIPYLCWCLLPALLFLPFSVLADVWAGRPLGTSVAIVSHPLQVFGLLPNEFPVNTPLWYLRTLLLLVLFAPMINWAVSRLGWFYIGILFGCVLLSASGIFSAYWGSSLLPIAGVFYFSFGWILNVRVDLDRGRGMYVVAIAACAGLALLLCGDKLAVTAAVPLILYVMWWVMPKRRLPDGLLSGTFLVFVAHMMVLNLFQMVFRRISISLALEQVVNWAGAIVIILSVNQFLRRRLSRIVSVLCGGR